VLERIDRVLLHPWLQRFAAASFLVGVVTFVFAWVTHTLRHTNLLGILGVALMAFGVLLFLVGWVGSHRPNPTGRQEVPSAARPLPPRLIDQVIQVGDLPLMVHGRAFIRCEIVGPPAALLARCKIEHSKWLGLFERSLVIIEDPTNLPPGTVSFVDCTFFECELQNFTAVGTEDQIKALKAAFPFV
jgi:hypothetical protein